MPWKSACMYAYIIIYVQVHMIDDDQFLQISNL